MFTMEQIRNMTYACINQSTLNQRVAISEKKLVNVHLNTIRLDEIDKQLKYESHTMHDELKDSLKQFRDDHAATQRHNEKTMLEHKMRLGSNSETIVKHREMIDENKHMLSAS